VNQPFFSGEPFLAIMQVQRNIATLRRGKMIKNYACILFF